jgi:hypothetical protein
MEKLAKAFVSDAFAQLAKGFLELLSSPRRRVSVGLDCEPWAESGPSILMASPWAIAHAIVMAITQGVNSEIPGLLVIPGIADDPQEDCADPAKPSSRVSREKKAKNRTLSSNQLFLGLCQSPRAAHMNSVHGYMGLEIVTSCANISPELGALVATLSANDLRARVQFAAACLHIPCPSVRAEAPYIQWLKNNSARALPLIRNYPQTLLGRVS